MRDRQSIRLTDKKEADACNKYNASFLCRADKNKACYSSFLGNQLNGSSRSSLIMAQENI